MSFAEILDAVDILPIEDQMELSELIRMRVIEQQREILAQEIIHADIEFYKGNLKIQSVDDILNG
jgi:hypothetical protein